jgi:hypothetical protein
VPDLECLTKNAEVGEGFGAGDEEANAGHSFKEATTV